MLKVIRREIGDIAILDIDGKILGGEDARPLQTEFDELIAGEHKAVVLNLKKVPWMNSSGLGTILAAFIRMRDYGAALKFLHAGERVAGILVTTRLVDLLETFDDETAAIESFGPRPGAEAGRS